MNVSAGKILLVTSMEVSREEHRGRQLGASSLSHKPWHHSARSTRAEILGDVQPPQKLMAALPLAAKWGQGCICHTAKSLEQILLMRSV